MAKLKHGISHPKVSGITPADQFNILLAHTSSDASPAPTNETAISAETTALPASPVISMTAVLDDIPCRFESGKLYQVVTDHVVFFSTGQIDKSLWPEEWFAKDVYAVEGDVVMFLGVVRYDLRNVKQQTARSMFALKFIYGETIVQYPIMRLMTIDPLGYPEVGEGLINPQKKEEEQRARNSLMYALVDVLSPVGTQT